MKVKNEKNENFCRSETEIVKKFAQWSHSEDFVGSVLSRFGLARPVSQLHRSRLRNQKVA